MKKLLFIIAFICLVSFETKPNIDEVPFSVMCELKSLNGVNYHIEQTGTKYFLIASNGTQPQELSFANAVEHCCEYGTGGGCEFPPQPGQARSYYVDLYKKYYP